MFDASHSYGKRIAYFLQLNAHLGSAEKTVSNADAEAANTARKMKVLSA